MECGQAVPWEREGWATPLPSLILCRLPKSLSPGLPWTGGWGEAQVSLGGCVVLRVTTPLGEGERLSQLACLPLLFLST